MSMVSPNSLMTVINLAMEIRPDKSSLPPSATNASTESQAERGTGWPLGCVRVGCAAWRERETFFFLPGAAGGAHTARLTGIVLVLSLRGFLSLHLDDLQERRKLCAVAQ
eukprot:scaffold9124_cov101-Isochrysis_galbana.AAC.6